MNPLFGILVLERDPISFKDLNRLALSWLQDAGGFAAVGLAIWLLLVLFTPAPEGDNEKARKRVTFLMLAAFVLAMIAYLCALILRYPITKAVEAGNQERFTTFTGYQNNALLAGGILALLGILDPFLRDLFRLRFGRIYALAKISFKEAVRRRVLWVLVAFLLPFLFPAQWFFKINPTDELRSTVAIVTFAMTALLLLMAGLMAAFSIPSDIKNQTIHTIITKPVERFEIVLGRFFGYTALMTLILVALNLLSLIFIYTSNVSEAAREETFKARVPVYGNLGFASNKAGFTGISVGREWEYRSYIAGSARSPERAIWRFFELPRTLQNQTAVPIEFAFDVFRTTKGDENKGVFCNFVFTTNQCALRYDPQARDWVWADPQRYEEFQRDMVKLGLSKDTMSQRKIRPDDEALWPKINEIAKKYGYFEFPRQEVVDYHTLRIEVPGGLFENAENGPKPKPGEQNPVPMFSVYVKCASETQFIGVAPFDLYILEREGSFGWNFLKGSLGLWCRLCIVIGLATACSTYLTGVISFLISVFLFITGLFQEFISTLAVEDPQKRIGAGGGPLEALTKLVSNKTLAAELDPSPTTQAALYTDSIFRWLLRRFQNILPDVDSFNWTNFVAEGFNISFEYMVVNLIILLGYLLPWGVLAYYLMRSREIAA